MRGWDEVEALIGLWVPMRAYLNRFILSPSSYCRRWTLILCAGALDIRMHQCVAHTNVMVILLLTYPHVHE